MLFVDRLDPDFYFLEWGNIICSKGGIFSNIKNVDLIKEGVNLIGIQ